MQTQEPRIKDAAGYYILPVEFTDKKFHFKQVFREGKFAIYNKTYPKTSINHFEAIEIQKHDGYTIAERYVEPAECYPSTSVFGQLGFDCMSLEAAQKRLSKMIEDDKKKL